MWKRWVKREGGQTYCPLDADGRIYLSQERAAPGPGEVVGEFRINTQGAAVITLHGPVVLDKPSETIRGEATGQTDIIREGETRAARGPPNPRPRPKPRPQTAEDREEDE